MKRSSGRKQKNKMISETELPYNINLLDFSCDKYEV